MRRLPFFAALAAVAVLAGCGATPQTSPGTSAPTPTSPVTGAVQPVGSPVDVTTGLVAPWSILRVSDEETLVSQRDDARILSVASDRSPIEVGVVPGVAPGGEGGLLGLAFLSTDDGD